MSVVVIMGIKGISWGNKGEKVRKVEVVIGAYISSSLCRVAVCIYKVFLVICIQVIISNSSRT